MGFNSAFKGLNCFNGNYTKWVSASYCDYDVPDGPYGE